MGNSNDKPTNKPEIEIVLEDGKTSIKAIPLLITDFKMAEGGDQIVVGLPEELHGIEVAVVLVAKP